MRLLHRHDDDLDDQNVRDPDNATRDPDAADERPNRWSFFHRDTAPAGEAAARRDTAVADRDRAEKARDRPAVERDRDRDARHQEVHEEVVERRKRWDTVGFLTAGFGAALAAMGAIALVRTGIDESWYRPVVEVAGVRQSPLMGAIEVAFGALLVLALLVGLRAVAALVALAGGVAATVIAIEPDRVNPELAIQRGWAIALAAVSLALGLLLVATRDRQRERRVIQRQRPVTA